MTFFMDSCNSPFNKNNFPIVVDFEELIWIEINGKYITQPLDSKNCYIINVKDFDFERIKEWYDLRKEHY